MITDRALLQHRGLVVPTVSKFVGPHKKTSFSIYHLKFLICHLVLAVRGFLNGK